MAQNAILAENTQSTVFLEAYGVFGFVMQFGGELPEFPLALGDECVVVWDGIEYNVTVGDSSAFMAGTKYVGNGAAFGLAGNNEPFVIAWDGAGATFVSFTDTAPTSHTIAIYQAVEDEPQEEVGIVIKNYSGIPIEYKGVEKVMFNTADGGKRVYSKGEALEDVSIELDFSSGDMTVKSAEGTLVKSAVIKKPDTLVAENIVKDVEIAGVVGMSEGGGSGQTKALFCNASAGRATKYKSGASSSNPNTVQVEVNITVPEQATIYKINHNSYTDVSVSSYPTGSFPTSVGGGSPEYSRSGSTVTANVTCKGESKYVTASAIVRVIYEMEGLFNRINGNKTTLYADETAAYFPSYTHFVTDYDVVDFSNSKLSKLSSNIFGNASEIYLPNIQSISYYAVDNVPNLKVFDLTKCTAVPTLSRSNFRTISEELEIRVPASLYDSFISATNWTEVASHIVAV